MSASELEDQAVRLVEQIAPAAVAEARKYLAERLQEMATTPSGYRNLLECLAQARPDFEPSTDFLAGVAFAADLVGDPNFDY